MPELEGLRRRVEAAEERFRFISRVQRADGERLIELLNRLKEEINTHKAESERYKSEVERLKVRNSELSDMLGALLDAVETFSAQSSLADFEDRIEALLDTEEAVVGAEAPRMRPVAGAEEEPDTAAADTAESEETDSPAADTEPVSDAEKEALELTETADPNQPQPKVEKIPSFFLRRDNEGRDKLIVRRGTRGG